MLLWKAQSAVRLGAVDYLLKPYSLRDTEAAIATCFGKTPASSRRQPHLSDFFNAARYHPGYRKAAGNHIASRWFIRQAELTGNEAALLMYLMQSPGVVHSCRALARSPLGYDVSDREAENLVRPHISRLRNKIETDPTHPTVIQTIRDRGYLFNAETGLKN
jgi:DNA-binding response OmpR family regulator